MTVAEAGGCSVLVICMSARCRPTPSAPAAHSPHNVFGMRCNALAKQTPIKAANMWDKNTARGCAIGAFGTAKTTVELAPKAGINMCSVWLINGWNP